MMANKYAMTEKISPPLAAELTGEVLYIKLYIAIISRHCVYSLYLVANVVL